MLFVKSSFRWFWVWAWVESLLLEDEVSCHHLPLLSKNSTFLPTHLISPNLSPFMIKIYLQTIAAIDRWGRIRGVVIGKQVKILIQMLKF